MEKCPISQCSKILNKNPGYGSKDDFQNLISSFLFTNTPVVKFSRRSIQHYNVKLLTDRQIDGQTDRRKHKRRAFKHNFLGGGN